jgi:hypothetical protein
MVMLAWVVTLSHLRVDRYARKPLALACCPFPKCPDCSLSVEVLYLDFSGNDYSITCLYYPIF